MFQIFISFLGLFFLIVLHEFSHFLAAKRLGVKVEEFGIGLPPRLIGKQFGETLYSINLIPFGAFVRLFGEEKEINDKRSFSAQPVSKRLLIAVAGVVSFWVISAFIFMLLFFVGNRVVVGDEDIESLISPKVQIAQVAPNSPANISKLKVGDTILEIRKLNGEAKKVEKITDVQGFVKDNLGEEIVLKIERGKKIFEVNLVPRNSPPEGEGPMGVILVKTAVKKYSFFEAIYQGIKHTFELTIKIINGYIFALHNLFQKKPTGVEMVGPVGIFQMTAEATQLGTIYFFNFLALISLYLAVFNLLPIPALDGGKVLFLTIEAIRRKPISFKTEQKITAFFFGLLILMAVFVTIKDIIRILNL